MFAQSDKNCGLFIDSVFWVSVTFFTQSLVYVKSTVEKQSFCKVDKSASFNREYHNSQPNVPIALIYTFQAHTTAPLDANFYGLTIMQTMSHYLV